jgi:MFS family permease
LLINFSLRRRINRFLSSGYLIVVVSFLILGITGGAQATFGVFFKPMTAEFGWDRAVTSGPFSVFMLVYGIFSIIIGRTNDRVNSWKLVSAGSLLVGAGFILMSTIHNIFQLYIYYGVLVAIGWSTMYIPLVSGVAKLFNRTKGFMSGIVVAGVGFGIGIIPPLTSQLIVTFQWRVAALWLGIMMTASILLLAQLLRIKATPEPTINSLKASAIKPVSVASNYSLKQIMKTSQFWSITAAWLLYGFFFQLTIVHIVPYGSDIGLSAVTAATVLTAIGLIGIFGRITMGYFGDKTNLRTTILIFYVICGLAFLLNAMFAQVLMLYTFAVLFGLLSGLGVLLIPLIIEYFGYRYVGVLSGIIIFANSIGGAIGPPLAGAIYDNLGHYSISFLICGILSIAASIAILFLKPFNSVSAFNDNY